MSAQTDCEMLSIEVMEAGIVSYRKGTAICEIRAVVKLLQERFHIAFEEAVVLFYKSETYKTLQETENGLWAESAEYIADRYYEEQGK